MVNPVELTSLLLTGREEQAYNSEGIEGAFL